MDQAHAKGETNAINYYETFEHHQSNEYNMSLLLYWWN